MPMKQEPRQDAPPTIAPCTQAHNAIVQSISGCLSARRLERVVGGDSMSKGLESRVRRHRSIWEHGQSDKNWVRQRVHLEGPMAPDTYVAEDDHFRHQ